MPESKRPLKVFLCHAHSDRTRVRDLYKRLTADGVDAWLDKEKLLPGQDWEFEIRKAVRETDLVMVCLSKQFNQAGFRQKEVRLALDTAMEKPHGEIFMIPLRFEESDSLDSLRHLHWVDLFEAGGYEKLMRSLNLRAEQVGAISFGESMSKSIVRIGEQDKGGGRNEIDRLAPDPAPLNDIAAYLAEMGEYSDAIRYFEQSLRLSYNGNSRISILNNLGSTYEKLGDLVRAVELYEQALKESGN